MADKELPQEQHRREGLTFRKLTKEELIASVKATNDARKRLEDALKQRDADNDGIFVGKERPNRIERR